MEMVLPNSFVFLFNIYIVNNQNFSTLIYIRKFIHLNFIYKSFLFNKHLFSEIFPLNKNPTLSQNFVLDGYPGTLLSFKILTNFLYNNNINKE